MSEYDRRLDGIIRRHLGDTILEALKNPDIEEVQVNPDMVIHLVSATRGILVTDERLQTAGVETFLNTVATLNKMHIAPADPSLAAVLPSSLGNCRLQGFLPPITTGPAFVLRKPPGRLIPLAEYVHQGSLSEKGRQTLTDAIASRANIIIIGATGSGKTTLCNALLGEVVNRFPKERVLLLEDTREIHLEHSNCLRLQTTDTVSMRALVRYSLRSAPHRIIVGEVRDQAARDLLDAWITGHPGGCGTVHGEDVQRGLERLADLASEATPGVDQRRKVAQAIQVAVVIAGYGTQRKVRSIHRVKGHNVDEFILAPLPL